MQDLVATIKVLSSHTFNSVTSVSVGGKDLLPSEYTVSGQTVTVPANKVNGDVLIVFSATAVNTGGGNQGGSGDAGGGTGGDTGGDLPNGNINITDMFVFSNTKKAYTTGGTLNASTYFDTSEKLDISSYVGSMVCVTHANFTPTAGGSSGYGLAFWDDNGIVAFNPFPAMTGVSKGPKGEYKVTSFIIPTGAKYVTTSKFNNDAITNNIYDGTEFKCEIVPLSGELVDITNQFVFNKTGVAQRTVEAGELKLGDYSSQYWNSAIVDMSTYAGQIIEVSTPVFRTSGNSQGPYGFLSEDSTGNLTVIHTFALLNDGNTGLGGSVQNKLFTLPQNIKYLRVCYYSSEMKNAKNPVPDEIINGFYCKVYN